jgi:TrmH family RNA methyltransferase
MTADPPRIASRTNAHFRAVRALAGSAAERRRKKQTLLDGAHLVAAYLACATPVLIAVSEGALGDPEISSLLERAQGVRKLCFADALFAQLAPVQTPTGILAVIQIPESPAGTPSGSLVVMLDGIQDPGNVGAIIRSAAAADADAVALSRGCADPWSPRALRAAMGAHFSLRIHAQCDLHRAAHAFDGRVVATGGRGGVSPHEVSLTGPVALLFGSEGAGLSEPLATAADAVISIPLARGIDSLNVGAAAAVILFERVRQLAAIRSASNR